MSLSSAQQQQTVVSATVRSAPHSYTPDSNALGVLLPVIHNTEWQVRAVSVSPIRSYHRYGEQPIRRAQWWGLGQAWLNWSSSTRQVSLVPVRRRSLWNVQSGALRYTTASGHQRIFVYTRELWSYSWTAEFMNLWTCGVKCRTLNCSSMNFVRWCMTCGQWRRHGGGQTGQLAPPPTSDRTPREIDADPRRFSCPKKIGVGLQDLLLSFTCTDATADVLWSYNYKKEGVVEVVKGVIFVGPRWSCGEA